MIKTILKNAFNFQGQNSRLAYFLYGLLFPVFLIAFTALVLIPYIELQNGLELNKPQMEGTVIGMLAAVPLFVSMMWVSLVQILKRMRDIGHSGWWIILVFLLSPLPYIGLLINLCFFCFLLFSPGKNKSNPQPLEWAWVLGALLLAFAVIAFESNRIKKVSKTLASPPSWELNESKNNTQNSKASSSINPTLPSGQINGSVVSPTVTGSISVNNSGPGKSNWSQKSYTQLKNKFLDMGLCNACADNIVHYVRATRESECSALAIKALNGDQLAISRLSDDFPEFCSIR